MAPLLCWLCDSSVSALASCTAVAVPSLKRLHMHDRRPDSDSFALLGAPVYIC